MASKIIETRISRFTGSLVSGEPVLANSFKINSRLAFGTVLSKKHPISKRPTVVRPTGNLDAVPARCTVNCGLLLTRSK